MTSDRLEAAFEDLKNILTQLQQDERNLASLETSSHFSTDNQNGERLASNVNLSDDSTRNQLNSYLNEATDKLNAVKKILEEFSSEYFSPESSVSKPEYTHDSRVLSPPKNVVTLQNESGKPTQSSSSQLTISTKVNVQQENNAKCDFLAELENVEREIAQRIKELSRDISQNSSQKRFASTQHISDLNSASTEAPTALSCTSPRNVSTVIESPKEGSRVLIGTKRLGNQPLSHSSHGTNLPTPVSSEDHHRTVQNSPSLSPSVGRVNGSSVNQNAHNVELSCNVNIVSPSTDVPNNSNMNSSNKGKVGANENTSGTEKKHLLLKVKNSSNLKSPSYTPPPMRGDFVNNLPRAEQSHRFFTPQQRRNVPNVNMTQPKTPPLHNVSTKYKNSPQSRERLPLASSVPTPSPLISPAIKVSPNISNIINSIYNVSNSMLQKKTPPISIDKKFQGPQPTNNPTPITEPKPNTPVNSTNNSVTVVETKNSKIQQQDNMKQHNENLKSSNVASSSSSLLSFSPHTPVNFLEYRIASPPPSRLYAPQTTLIVTSQGFRHSRSFVFSLLSSSSASQPQVKSQTQSAPQMQTQTQSPQSPPSQPHTQRVAFESSSPISIEHPTSSSLPSKVIDSSVQIQSESSSSAQQDHEAVPLSPLSSSPIQSPPQSPRFNEFATTGVYSAYEIIEDVVLPDEMNIVFRLPPKKTSLRMSIKTDNSIIIVKGMVFAEAEKANVPIEGIPTQYCFRAEEDDYFLDETAKMKDLSYLSYCVKNCVTPVIDLVLRSEYDTITKQIEEMVGGPLPNYPEVAEFRKDMQITMNYVLRAAYRRERKSHSTQITAGIEKSLCKQLPKEFNVYFFFSYDKFLPQNRKFVVVQQLATVTDVLEAIFKKCPGVFGLQAAVCDFVLKIRGVNEYLVSFMILISMPYIRECLRKRRDVEFVVYRRNELTADIIEYVKSLEQTPWKGKVIDISVFRRASNVKVISPPPSLSMKRTKYSHSVSPVTNSVAYLRRIKTTGTLRAARVNEVDTPPISSATTVKSTLKVKSDTSLSNESGVAVPASSSQSPLSSPISVVQDANSGNDNDSNVSATSSNSQSSSMVTTSQQYEDGASQSSPPNLLEFNVKSGTLYGISSWELNYPLRVRIKNLDSIPFDPKLFKIAKRKEVVEWYISVGVYHVGERIQESASTVWVFRDTNDNSPNQSPWLTLPVYSCIPWASILHFQVHVTKDKRDVVVAWANVRIFDFRGFAHMGEYLQPLVIDNNPDPLAPLLQDVGNGPKIHFEIETLEHPVVYPDFELTDVLLQKKMAPETCPHNLQSTLLEIINRDPLYKLTKEDKELIWKFRGWLKGKPRAITKCLQSVPWSEPDAILETYTMLQTWPDIPPTDALELLTHHFVDKNIRDFAISQLQRLSDDDLQDFLLQLVQALKHEMNHDSALARFLIIRAIFNQTQIGHYFFWLLQGCLSQNSPFRERYGIVLEIYLRYCGKFREKLCKQIFVYKKLTEVAVALKQIKDKKKMGPFLKEQLESLQSQLPSEFQVPIDSNLIATRLLIDKCKFLDSKTFPLWLAFANADPLGDPIYVILKVGDDLRQDQLTLQMFRIMDKMWLQEGLDLKMSPYQVIETGNDTGMIEVVPNSETTAAIQKVIATRQTGFVIDSSKHVIMIC